MNQEEKQKTDQHNTEEQDTGQQPREGEGGSAGEDAPEGGDGELTEAGERDVAPTEDDAGGHEEEEETQEVNTEQLISELEEDVDELNDKYQRALARMENMRKTHSKELKRVHEQGRESLLEDITPVLDLLTKAQSLFAEGADPEKIRDGVERTLNKFRQALEKHGIELIEASGVRYDPARHQAIHKETSEEVDEPTVSEVYQLGFAMGERVVRPATVQVYLPPGSEQAKPSGEGSEETGESGGGESGEAE